MTEQIIFRLFYCLHRRKYRFTNCADLCAFSQVLVNNMRVSFENLTIVNERDRFVYSWKLRWWWAKWKGERGQRRSKIVTPTKFKTNVTDTWYKEIEENVYNTDQSLTLESKTDVVSSRRKTCVIDPSTCERLSQVVRSRGHNIISVLTIYVQ